MASQIGSPGYPGAMPVNGSAEVPSYGTFGSRSVGRLEFDTTLFNPFEECASGRNPKVRKNGLIKKDREIIRELTGIHRDGGKKYRTNQQRSLAAIEGSFKGYMGVAVGLSVSTGLILGSVITAGAIIPVAVGVAIGAGVTSGTHGIISGAFQGRHLTPEKVWFRSLVDDSVKDILLKKEPQTEELVTLKIEIEKIKEQLSPENFQQTCKRIAGEEGMKQSKIDNALRKLSFRKTSRSLEHNLKGAKRCLDIWYQHACFRRHQADQNTAQQEAALVNAELDNVSVTDRLID